MRILDFSGEIPKTKPQALPQHSAQYAENVDLYGGLLRPHRNPQFQQYVVDEFGKPFRNPDDVKTFAMVGQYAVGFPADLHWVRDPRESAGKDTILFVRSGRLWRLSGRMVETGTGATPVGIEPPKEPPTAAVAKGQGCKSEWEQMCGTVDRGADCDHDAPELRAYRITYVNECGEESAPSGVSNLIDIKNGDGGIVVDTNTPPANAVKRRYYRSATTTNGVTMWLYVGEDIIGDTTFIDDVCPNALGEALPTEDHEPPSNCLDGVALTRNMSTIVWSNNQFWVSEPRLPHAYKPETRITLPYKIQFVAYHTPTVEGDTHYDNVVTTVGYPYAVEVRDDLAARVHEIEHWYPALSPFGWTTLAGSVFYTTHAGLVAIAGKTVNVLTDELMTENEWATFLPTSMRLTGYDQRLFMWYTKPDGVRSGLLLDVPLGDKRRSANLTRLTLQVKSGYASPDIGMFMLMGSDVYKWGTGTGYMRYTWWSKIEVNSAYWFPTVFKIVGDDVPVYRRGLAKLRHKYEMWQKQNCDVPPSVFFDSDPKLRPHMAQILNYGADVVFTIYCDGDEYFSRPVRTTAPVMIKARRRGIEWSIKVTGTTVLRELHLQKSLNDLQNDGGHA